MEELIQQKETVTVIEIWIVSLKNKWYQEKNERTPRVLSLVISIIWERIRIEKVKKITSWVSKEKSCLKILKFYEFFKQTSVFCNF